MSPEPAQAPERVRDLVQALELAPAQGLEPALEPALEPELEPAVERIEANLGEKPKQMVVDAGLTNQATMEEMAEKQVDLMGDLPERR